MLDAATPCEQQRRCGDQEAVTEILDPVVRAAAAGLFLKGIAAAAHLDDFDRRSGLPP